MSGYATRLAARGMGRAAGALLAPRAVPRAIPGAPPPTIDAAATSTRPSPLAQVAEQPPGRAPVAEPATAQAPPPTSRPPDSAETRRSNASRRVTPTRTQPAAPVREPEHTTEPAPSAARTHEIHVWTERIQSVAEPKVAALAKPPVQGPPKAPIVRPAMAEPLAPTPVELRLRQPAAPPLPASPATRATSQTQAPTIEVRIGRVEVRAPRPPELPGWSTSAPPPATAASAEPAFARMAAARRYLDRSWG